MSLLIPDAPISLATWLALGVAAFLIISALVIFIVGYRNRQLPPNMRNQLLEEQVQRIGRPIQLIGAGAVVILGIMNIMGWRL